MRPLWSWTLNPQEGHEIVGVRRLSKHHGEEQAEFAIVISDKWQGHGLGTELLKQLISIGRGTKLKRIIGYILPDNSPMRHVAKRLGFRLHQDDPGAEWKAELEIFENARH